MIVLIKPFFKPLFFAGTENHVILSYYTASFHRTFVMHIMNNSYFEKYT